MGQEIFMKCPDGYREATPDERKKIQNVGFTILIWDKEVRACDAELGRAQFALERAQRERQIALGQREDLHKAMGVQGLEGSLHAVSDDMIFVLVDPEKRILELPKTPKPGITATIRDGNGKVISGGPVEPKAGG